MIVTITLNGLSKDPPATIKSKDFTSEDEIAFLERNAGSLKNRFLAGFTPRETEEEKLKHITLEYYYKTGSDKEIIATMKRVTRKVMTILEDRIRQTGHVTLKLFLRPENLPCVGYRYLDERGVDRVALVLGETSMIREWAPTPTVADRHYGQDPDKHIQASVLHELGHVFHQCFNLKHFMTLARGTELGAQGDSATTVEDNRKGGSEWPIIGEALPADKTDAATLCRFIKISRALGNGLSYYAQRGGMNEFVAEVFSALSMNLSVSSALDSRVPSPTREQVLLAYTRLGMPLGLGVLPAPEAPSSARAGVLVPATGFPAKAATTAATESKTGLGKG